MTREHFISPPIGGIGSIVERVKGLELRAVAFSIGGEGRIRVKSGSLIAGIVAIGEVIIVDILLLGGDQLFRLLARRLVGTVMDRLARLQSDGSGRNGSERLNRNGR